MLVYTVKKSLQYLLICLKNLILSHQKYKSRDIYLPIPCVNQMIGSFITEVTSRQPQSDVRRGDGDNRDKYLGKKWEGTSFEMINASISHD